MQTTDFRDLIPMAELRQQRAAHRYPFRSQEEYDALLATMAPRCLGCAAVLEPDESTDDGLPTWRPHGTTCLPYYGAGERVDYDAWCAILDRVTDEPLFGRWAAAEPMLGVPSWSA